MVFTGGAELSGYFSMEDLFDSIDMSLSVSYSWLKTVDFDESSVNYLRQLAYRPEHSGRAGLLLSLPEVLSFDFNISYMGYRYTNNSNTKYLESVIVLDAALNYDISENFRISVAAGNFTNVQYIDRLGYPVPGFEWTVKGRVSL
jgi:outer membrane receptor protein involved in Fe transport